MKYHYWLKVDFDRGEMIAGNLENLSTSEKKMMLNGIPTISISFDDKERKYVKTLDEGKVVEKVPLRFIAYDYQEIPRF